MRKSDTRLVAHAALIAGLLCLPAVAWGNAASQALYTKGLIPFNAEHWSEAYQLFDAAVAADPNDPLAAYYRGLCAARLGFPDVAKKEIERALRLWPALPGAALDLGIVYFDAQQYEQAETWLHQAYAQPNDRFAAALFLGISRYRRNDDAGAIQYLSEAAKDPELRPTAQYYQALALLRQGQREQANQLLGDVRAAKPESEIGQIANDYLTTGVTAAPPTTVAEPAPVAPVKPWGLYAGGAFEYDSNVVLASSEDVIQDERNNFSDISGEGDGRFVINAGGYYRLVDRAVNQNRLRFSLGYDFSQSIHFDLRDFDLQTHRLHGDFDGGIGAFEYGLTGWYEYALLDYSSFVQRGSAVPWVTFYEGRVAATQLYYRFLGKDYLDDPFDPFLDGINNALGVRQSFLLGAADRSITFGYQWDDENASSIDVNGVSVPDQFDYQGHQLDAVLASGIAGWVDVAVGYLFHYMEYSDANPRNASGFHRRDRVHQILAEVQRPIIDRLTARFWYIGTFDDSNTDEFRYDRHIVHLGVMYAY